MPIKIHLGILLKSIIVSPVGGQAAGGHRGVVVAGEANSNGKMLDPCLFDILQTVDFYHLILL